jgi:hypothetical protein
MRVGDAYCRTAASHSFQSSNHVAVFGKLGSHCRLSLRAVQRSVCNRHASRADFNVLEQVRLSLTHNSTERQRRLTDAPSQPEKYRATTTVFKRNPDVMLPQSTQAAVIGASPSRVTRNPCCPTPVDVSARGTKAIQQPLRKIPAMEEKKPVRRSWYRLRHWQNTTNSLASRGSVASRRPERRAER